jgi:membrane protein YdbS with pleckstrin-like domain
MGAPRIVAIWLVVIAVAVVLRLLIPSDIGLTVYFQHATHYVPLKSAVFWTLISILLIRMILRVARV